jgi:hypothetical protein
MKMGKLHFKENIRKYLEVIADSKRQWEEGPTEIICMWFDDLYFPSFDSKIYNSGIFEKGLEDFESCFSKDELKAMQVFHGYFNSIADKIDTDKPFEEIQKDPNWIRLGSEAEKVLKTFQNQISTTC